MLAVAPAFPMHLSHTEVGLDGSLSEHFHR